MLHGRRKLGQDVEIRIEFKQGENKGKNMNQVEKKEHTMCL